MDKKKFAHFNKVSIWRANSPSLFRVCAQRGERKHFFFSRFCRREKRGKMISSPEPRRSHTRLYDASALLYSSIRNNLLLHPPKVLYGSIRFMAVTDASAFLYGSIRKPLLLRPPFSIAMVLSVASSVPKWPCGHQCVIFSPGDAAKRHLKSSCVGRCFCR